MTLLLVQCSTSLSIYFYSITFAQAALYGTAQAIPDRSLITEMARGYLAACYNTAMGESNGVAH